jgi:hypothetical protein
LNIPFTLSSGQSIVQNGGFESGSFTGWTISGKDFTSYNFVDSGDKLTPYDGNYCAALGEYRSYGYLSQTLDTVPKQSYLLSFWTENPYAQRGVEEKFTVEWNGKSVSSHSYTTAFGWTKMTFTVKATKTLTVLEFKERNDGWYFGLDDVSVTPIPVPTLQPAVDSRGRFSFTWNALPDVNYQIQYKTNLMQPDWMNLGESVNARAATMSATNAAVTDPQRFYRVVIPDQNPGE